METYDIIDNRNQQKVGEISSVFPTFIESARAKLNKGCFSEFPDYVFKRKLQG